MDGQAVLVGEVDPGDDSIERYVVQHYRFDPARSERRHVVVAAYDNAREFEARVERDDEELERRRARGEDVDSREHVSGAFLQPGHSRLAANGRLVQRAFPHGASPGQWLDELELPSYMWVMRTPDSQTEGQASAEEP